MTKSDSSSTIKDNITKIKKWPTENPDTEIVHTSTHKGYTHGSNLAMIPFQEENVKERMNSDYKIILCSAAPQTRFLLPEPKPKNFALW